MTIDYSKILSPEDQDRIARAAVAPDVPELPVPEIEPVEPITVPAPEEDIAAGVIPGKQVVTAPKVSALDPKAVERNAKLNVAKKDAEARLAAQQGLFQKMLDERKASLEAQRTDNVRLARFNALGNALRTMVQPLGWAIGGSTASVQPYDNRQYLEAFNRAVKADQDLRNLAGAQEEYALKLGEHATQRAEAEYDFQRRQNESEEAFYRRLDEQAKITAAKSLEDRSQKRWDMVIRAWMQENNSNVRKGQKTLTLSEYLNRFGGVRDAYLNGAALSDKEIDAIGDEAVANNGKVAAPATGTDSSATVPAQGLTEAEKAIIKKWSAADYNKDGVVSKDERDVYNSRAKMDGKPKMGRKDRNEYNLANKGKKVSSPAAAKPAKKSLRDVATR